MVMATMMMIMTKVVTMEVVTVEEVTVEVATMVVEMGTIVVIFRIVVATDFQVEGHTMVVVAEEEARILDRI